MLPLEANVCVLFLARAFVGKPKQPLQNCPKVGRPRTIEHFANLPSKSLLTWL